MSILFSSEHLADLRDGARWMVERTGVHEGDLNALVETAEAVARQADALALALAGGEMHADELGRLCSAQVLEPWFDAVVSKPSPPDVVLAAVQDAARR